MTAFNHLQESGMATALSIDQWLPTKESKCDYEEFPDLSVNSLCMHPPATQQDHPPNKAAAARYQEIFIDLVGMHCASLDAASRHVLDDRFDSCLQKGEREFKDSLLEFLANQSKEAQATRAFQYLEETLQKNMGYNAGLLRPRKNTTRAKCMPSDSAEIETTSESLVQPPMPQREGPAYRSSTCTNNPGHVFVCNASVCDLQCDAFLCPAQISHKKGRLNGTIASRWRKNILGQNQVLLDSIPFEGPWKFKTYPSHQRVITFRDWPWQGLQKSGKTPNPFLVAGEVSLEKSREFADMSKKAARQGELPPKELHIEALMETVRQFLTVAVQELQENQPSPGTFRERYLLAIPVLGTGGGCAGDLAGQIVTKLLQTLSDFVVQREDVDVALVCADEAMYARAQTLRKDVMDEETLPSPAESSPATAKQVPLDWTIPCFQHLGRGLQVNALQLAQLASKQQLALFIGAGVSIGSGLPGWFGLLHKIEDAFDFPVPRQLGEECGWDPLKMAAKLDEVCKSSLDNQGESLPLKQRLCSYIKESAHCPGLLLSLLMSLPCDSTVTQNYDQLIEKACECQNIVHVLKSSPTTPAELSVIPYQPKRKATQWLLKMHGCVSVPDEIVITREDYETYESSRGALGGLVQASLMTKHLIFVGFSLTDPNYLRIVDEVRAALRPPTGTTS
ncbi:expressed unknown protein [Seminavis robusta]|uniref:SIR2-like domain-containing protein n=1 Tax=Seminavis robusta TaxID=568900 RepID=A0A9N8HMU4_9STRA|nr:expressed unknown protein [Seminavis robusta]|eukprot:Sro772_g200300.1 n/a (679) ;mRNA; f:33023-35059